MQPGNVDDEEEWGDRGALGGPYRNQGEDSR